MRIVATTSGYVQTLNRDGLLETAEQQDLMIEVLRRPGDFLFEGDALVHAWRLGTEPPEDMQDGLAAAISASAIGARRPRMCGTGYASF